MHTGALPHFGHANALPGATISSARANAGTSLTALSADALLLKRWPAAPQRARVHSVFARVVNVELASRRLLSLAQRDADDAPASIVVDLDSWSALGISPGTDVRLASGRIDLGDRASIALADARRWPGRLPPYARDDSLLRRNLPTAQQHLDRLGTGLGHARASPPDRTGLDEALLEAFRRNADGLCGALAHGDAPRARAHVEQLVGLGPGLTPAGDDFLLGLLAALHIPGSPAQACRSIGAHIVECTAQQSPQISAAALRHAANGRLRARVIGLCDALLHGSSASLRHALETVMRIGATSGSEIAAGVLAGFRLHVQCVPARCATAGVP